MKNLTMYQIIANIQSAGQLHGQDRTGELVEAAINHCLADAKFIEDMAVDTNIQTQSPNLVFATLEHVIT